MEAIILAGGKAERLGDAAGGRPKALVEIARKPFAAYQVGRLAKAGVDARDLRVRCGPGLAVLSELAGLGPEIVAAEEPERLGRGGAIKFAATFRVEQGDVFALNGDELVDVDFAGAAGRARSRRRARRRSPWRSRRSQFGLVDVGDDDVVHGFREGGHVSFWVNCGNYVLSEEAIERFPDQGDHESSTFPELAAEGRLRAYRHDGALADREHAEGAANRRRSTSSRIRSGWRDRSLCVMTGSDSMGVDSPNVNTLDRWAFQVTKVEKPWGHELIWALTGDYCGKLLFVKAGHSLSLQFHRVKDESWLVQSGRAQLELGEVGETVLKQEVIGAGRRVPLCARHRAPRHGARGHDDPRGLDAAARRCGAARGRLRPRRHLGALATTFTRFW